MRQLVRPREGACVCLSVCEHTCSLMCVCVYEGVSGCHGLSIQDPYEAELTL